MNKMKQMKKTYHYHLMVLPGLIWLVLFNIVPMFGIVMAFQDFNPGEGILGSELIGLDNFIYLFSLSSSQSVIANTLVIAVTKLVLNVLVPLTFALLLNEVLQVRYKKIVQTIVYLPHFLSWVILASILLQIFSYRGPVNSLISMIGLEPQIWFSKEEYFRGLVIWSDVWKEFGFNAVIYLAALTGINPSLYEAAAIDGCGKLKAVRYITLPGISSTVILLSILGLGNVLNAGFDQIYNLYNPLVYSTGDILDTWVYRMGLIDVQFSLATTAGLFKSAVSFILIVTSYKIASKFANYKII